MALKKHLGILTILPKYIDNAFHVAMVTGLGYVMLFLNYLKANLPIDALNRSVIVII
jgi:hypothetical protein